VDGRFVLLIGSLGLKDQSRSKAKEGEKSIQKWMGCYIRACWSSTDTNSANAWKSLLL